MSSVRVQAGAWWTYIRVGKCCKRDNAERRQARLAHLSSPRGHRRCRREAGVGAVDEEEGWTVVG